MVPAGVSAEVVLDMNDLASVTFTNYLEWSIYYLFISPSDTDYYGGDVIDTTGAITMSPYDSLLLYMLPGEYDVLILDEDFDVWTGTYTVADGSEIIFSEFNLDYEEYGFSDQLIFIDIYVETAASVEYLFLSPTDSDSWGVDLLGIWNLYTDDVLSVTLLEYDNPVDYDLLAVFDDGTQVTMSVEAVDGGEFYLVDTSAGDDDDIVDDDIVDDDIMDDDIVDDDDNITDDDDIVDDDDNIPGGVSGNEDDDIEGEDKKKDSDALGISLLVFSLLLIAAVKFVRRK
ncbi:MAG: hypothetical protein ACMUIE_08115 [Thermoplasmatota archaeon]